MSNLSECYKSNPNNPMMNFLPFDNRNRQSACLEKVENNNGIQGIYTMPVTTNVPDTIEFAKLLFPNPAKCRETGYLCYSTADNTMSLDRLAYYKDEKYFQTINSSAKSDPKFSILSHTNP